MNHLISTYNEHDNHNINHRVQTSFNETKLALPLTSSALWITCIPSIPMSCLLYDFREITPYPSQLSRSIAHSNIVRKAYAQYPQSTALHFPPHINVRFSNILYIIYISRLITSSPSARVDKRCDSQVDLARAPIYIQSHSRGLGCI